MLDKYNAVNWQDRNVEYPRRVKLEKNEDGTYEMTKVPGEVFDSGTPVNSRNLNHMDTGIGENRDAIMTLQDNVTALNVQTQVMFGSVANGMTDNIFIEDLENLDDVVVERGIYSYTDKKIYV